MCLKTSGSSVRVKEPSSNTTPAAEFCRRTGWGIPKALPLHYNNILKYWTLHKDPESCQVELGPLAVLADIQKSKRQFEVMFEKECKGFGVSGVTESATSIIEYYFLFKSSTMLLPWLMDATRCCKLSWKMSACKMPQFNFEETTYFIFFYGSLPRHSHLKIGLAFW